MTSLQQATADASNDFYESDDVDLMLADDISCFYADPLGFVRYAFEWDEGDLTGFDGPDEWQIDILTTIGNAVTDRKFNGVTPVDPIRVAVSSGHGIGKAQPYSLIFDTPDGVRQWCDIQPGDILFGRDGKPTTVIARHEQGDREVYRVTFSDGSSTLVDKEHVWSVKGRQQRRQGHTWVEMTTAQILAVGVKRSNGVATARQWEIPGNNAVEYPAVDLPIDPYIVGVWLGDGTKRCGAVTSADPEVFESAIDAGYKLGSNRHTGSGAARTHTLMGLKVQLRDAGILGCTTDNCSVSDQYKYSSIDQRSAMLQGLLDTDGWVEQSGTVAFGSISEKLTDDVIWLARSLGLVARKNPVKSKWYRNADGVKVKGRPFYAMTMTWDGATQLFRLDRKQNLLRNPQSRYQKRWVDNIEFSHVEQAMCVTVDAADSLYLTNDFIVTHNSALSAWLILWVMSTRPNSKGVVTANTGDQLKTKTMSELAKWHTRCITSHWFEVSSMSISHRAYPETWRVDGLTSREESSESFAGLHCADSTPWYLFDEASAIPEKIWEVASGGLTDGEPMHFAFGNPTKNSGSFYECFRHQSHRWITRQVDSRTAKMTNKAYIQEIIDDYGIDSDRVRVRIRGMFPKGGDMQFMPSDVVFDAQKRGPGQYLGDDPLICGFDVARGGDDNCFISFRRGKDAKSERVYKIPGEKSRDSMKVVSLMTMILDRHKPDVTFIDVTGMGGPIGDRLRQLGYHCIDIGFGHKADDEQLYSNKTAEMGATCREWLMAGGAIADDPQLEIELTSREFGHNNKDQLVLERKKDVKKRLGVSPDWADSLYLTFAQAVPKRSVPRGHLDAGIGARQRSNVDYDPLDAMDSDY